MRVLLLSAALLSCLAVVPASAQDVTATCNDGSTFSGATRRGACSRHGGVKEFGAAPATAPAPPTAAPVATPAAPATAAAPATTAAPALGGGARQVWVNTASKVYHCQGDRWYGKTKAGKYVTESAARAEGDRPDHGKACS